MQFDWIAGNQTSKIIINRYYRFEFQDSGAPGNKPHIHAGITLEEGCETEEQKAARVIAHENDLLCKLNGHDCQTCIDKGE